MEPKVGRALWRMLHGFADGYPRESPSVECRHLAAAFVAHFRDDLLGTLSGQCSCKTTMAKACKAFPPDLTSRAGFTEWVQALHDLVNIKLGKPRFKPDLRHPMLTPEAIASLLPPSQ